MFRTTLLRGVSAGAMTLAALSSADAQTKLPAIDVGASRPAPAIAAPTRPVQRADVPASPIVRARAPAPVVRAPEPAPTQTPTVVGAKPPSPTPLSSSILTTPDLAGAVPHAADTVQLLERTPGVSFYEAGGVSRLPALHGMADDRVNILLGGVSVTAACANHMNSPLSYMDPNNVGKIEVLAGVTPVSKGGDSIGGSILVEPKAPIFASAAPAPGVAPAGAPGAAAPPPPAFWPFAAPGTWRVGPGGAVLATGSISAFYRGNNRGIGVSGTANVATDHWALLYNGAWSRAIDYREGVSGPKVLSTNFISEHHSATLAYQNDGHFLAIRGAIHNIPYQGYPNQRMDMIHNRAYTIDGNYRGAFDWGSVDARAYWHLVNHKMGFLYDKQPANHPMVSQGRDFGYSIKANIPIGRDDQLRIGNEFHGQRLNDWWPNVWFPTFNGIAVVASHAAAHHAHFMGPFDQKIVNGGQRNRLGTYAEWERIWSPQWTTLLGVRNDVVWMNTGPAQAYDPRAATPVCHIHMHMGAPECDEHLLEHPVANPNGVAAALFNAQNRARTDVNFDAVALARYQPDQGSWYEFGYARKTRSPNLYERYQWVAFGGLSGMINWFGDGNGYVGNLNLKPEVAHNFSVTGYWRDPTGNDNYEAKITPYYSYVENYIDADRIGNFSQPAPYVFQTLQFRNHKAELYGVDAFGRLKLYEAPEFGRLSFSAWVNYFYGRNLDIGNTRHCLPTDTPCALTASFVKRGDGLYNLMPLNARFALEHRYQGLSLAVETQLVDSNNHVSAMLQELVTHPYALLHLRSSYEWQNLRFDLGVENITDTRYQQPLGGFYFAGYKYGSNFSPAAALANARQVPGMGRNFYAGVTVKF